MWISVLGMYLTLSDSNYILAQPQSVSSTVHATPTTLQTYYVRSFKSSGNSMRSQALGGRAIVR